MRCTDTGPRQATNHSLLLVLLRDLFLRVLPLVELQLSDTTGISRDVIMDRSNRDTLLHEQQQLQHIAGSPTIGAAATATAVAGEHTPKPIQTNLPNWPISVHASSVYPRCANQAACIFSTRSSNKSSNNNSCNNSSKPAVSGCSACPDKGDKPQVSSTERLQI